MKLITKIVEEEGFLDDILKDLEGLQGHKVTSTNVMVEVHSRKFHDEL